MNKIISVNYNRLIQAFSIFIIFSVLLVSVFGTSLVNKSQAKTQNFTDDTNISTPTNIYGVEMAEITPTYGLNEMVAAGTPWVRINGVLWSQVESTPGVYDWSVLAGLEEQLSTAQANGMDVYLVVRGTPTWAQMYPGYSCGPMTENAIKDFANFMEALVDRYKNQVKYWEIWNEPDAAYGETPPDALYGCWGDSSDTTYFGGDYYGQVLSQVYPAVKDADPTAQVLVGGLLMNCSPSASCNSSSIKFIDGFLSQGNGNNFDGIAFHAYDYYQGGLGNYGNTNWNASRATTGPVELEKQKYLKNKLAQYGVIGKYLINSELALVCNSGCTSTFETTKQYYLAQAYAAALARNFWLTFWYGAKMGWKETDLLKSDNSPRPAYYAYEFGRIELDNATYSKDVDQYSGVMGFEFTKSDRRVWVLWSKDGANHQITLPEFPLAIYDVDGDPRTQSTTVTITLEPYYIELSRRYNLFAPVTMQNYQAILNHGFERGIGTNGNPVNWEFTKGTPELPAALISTNPTQPWLDTSIPIGSSSVQMGNYIFQCLGGVPANAYGGVKQSFVVPYTLNKVFMTFKYIVYSQDISTQSNFDGLDVVITDENNVKYNVFHDGNMDTSDLGSCNWHRVPASGWATGEVDLTIFRGKNITVEFQTWNRIDTYYNTMAYIDQVYIEFRP
jgi:hypothetical protein